MDLNIIHSLSLFQGLINCCFDMENTQILK